MIFLGVFVVVMGFALVAMGLDQNFTTAVEKKESCDLISDAVLKVYVQREPNGDAAAIAYAQQVRAWAENLPDKCQRDSYIKWANASESNARGATARRNREEAERKAAIEGVLSSGKIVMPPNPLQ